MNALLIYPAFPDTFWSFKHALKFIHKKAAYPPLGLLTVGAILPEKWSKRLVDLNVAEFTQKDMEWADCVVISAMAIQRESSNQVIAICKDAGLKVIAGGPLFTNEYDQFEAVDHIVMNEAELALPSFLADLAGDCAKHLSGTSEFADMRKTPAPMWELIDFIQKSGIVTAMVGLLQAPPGTKLYDRLKKAGRVCGYISGDNVDGTTNIIPKMGMSTLLKGYRKIQKNIYLPAPYYQRVKTFLREYKAPRIFVKMDFQRLLAFFRSCVIIGIFGKERFQFWSLFFWTLFRCPRFLPLTIAFAIYGYHFRRICKL